MVLSSHNKKAIEEVVKHIKPNAEAIGADALARLFELHPQTKTYFKSFDGYTASASSVRKHGRVVMDAVVKAAENLDNLAHGVGELARKHGEELLVDPHNFHLFADTIEVSLAIFLPSFPPATHRAVDKFLDLLAHELSSCYR